MASNPEAPVGERELSKLRWRCRRGLLENDLLIERFFRRRAVDLSAGEAETLHTLMDLSDNDLLDLLLGRAQPTGAQATPAARRLIDQIRNPAP